MKRARPSRTEEASEASEAAEATNATPRPRFTGSMQRLGASVGASPGRLARAFPRAFRRSRAARLVAAGGAVVAAAFVLGTFVVVPMLVDSAVRRYGADVPGRGADVERVRVDPLTLTAVLEAVELTDAASGARLAIAELRLNFDFRTLFRRTVALDELRVGSPRLRVDVANGDAAASAASVGSWFRSGVDSRPFTIDRVALTDGRIEFVDDAPGAPRELTVDGVDLELQGLATGSQQPALFDARLSGPEGGALRLGGELTTEPAGASGSITVRSTALGPLRPWFGRFVSDLQADGVVDAEARYVWTPASLALSDLAAAVREPRIALDAGRAAAAAAAELRGDVELAVADGAASIRFSVDAGFDAVRISDPSGSVLLESARLAIDDASPQSAGGAVRGIRAEALRLERPRMQVAVDARSWSADDPLAALRHAFDDAVSVGSGGATAAVAVRRVDIVDGRFDFEDRTVTPPVRVDLTSVEGMLGRAAPDRDDVVVDVSGAVGDGGLGAIAISFAGRADGRRVELNLRGLDAPTLSPYFEALSGPDLVAGAVDLELEYRNRVRRAQGEARLTARGLELGAAGDDRVAAWGRGDSRPGEATSSEAAAHAAGAGGFEATGAAEAGDRGATVLQWELAHALLEDADGRMVLTLPLDGEGAGVAAALGAALGNAVIEVTAMPFDVLADVAGGDAEPPRAIPFEPGEAEPGDAAAATLRTLGIAFERRPRLGLRVAGRADPELDRDALAAQQIELHVTLATAGPTLVARPQPVDFTSPRAWDVLDEFATERLSAERLATVASYFDRDAEGRVVEADKPSYYRALFDELVANEPIPDAALIRLGRYRAQAIADALVRLGIAPERLETLPAVLTEPGAAAAPDDVAARTSVADASLSNESTDEAPPLEASQLPPVVEVPLELRPVMRVAPAEGDGPGRAAPGSPAVSQ